MKPIVFTNEERSLLKRLLKIRLEVLNNLFNETEYSNKASQRRFENFYLKPLLSVIDKISTHDTAIYNSNEKLCFISCIKEHDDNFYKELNLPGALSWLSVSDEQKEVIGRLDNCKDILMKSGYFNKKDDNIKINTKFRYRDILTKVEKLKNSDRVFLSKEGQNNFYKIAFINEGKEYLSFELKNKISIFSNQFTSLDGKSPDVIATKQFSLIADKTKAKELLATCETRNYPDGVLDFVNALLNY